jgi:hypothetical protein
MEADLDTRLRYVFRHVRFVKEANGWNDVTPVLFCFRKAGGRLDLAVLAVPEDYITEAVSQTIAVEPNEMVFMVNDVYMAKFETVPSTVRLAERWQAGDRDGITEAISILVVSDEGAFAATQRYDTISQTWGDIDEKGPAEGRLAAVLLNAYQASKAQLQ